MTCNSVDSIIDIINQMQVMNSLSLNPSPAAAATTTNTPAMPFMAVNDSPNKQVSFNEPPTQQLADPLLQSLHLITHKLDSCAVSMHDSRKNNDRSRNRDRSSNRGRNRSSSRSKDRFYRRDRSDFRNRSNSRDRDRYYNTDRDYRDYRDRNYRQDYRSRDFDRSRNFNRSRDSIPDQRGYWKRQNYSHCTGCSCNNHQHNNQQQNQQGRSNGKHARTSRSNTPCPDTMYAMTDVLHALIDDSCSLLELQEEYQDSLNY